MTNDSTTAPVRASTKRSSPTAGHVAVDITENYTHEQLGMVLEYIAAKADALDRMLLVLQCRSLDEEDAAAMLDGAQAIAENLGAVADRFAPAKFRCPDKWLFGDRFPSTGKAGAA